MMFKDKFLKLDTEKYINLEHVSHISLDYSKDKVIFKMDYAMNVLPKKRGEDRDSQEYNLFNENNKETFNSKKIITGYIYGYGITACLKSLKASKFFEENFIQKTLNVDDANDVGWINLGKVTSFKFDDSRNRVVINFANSVTYYDFTKKEELLTSEFLYLDFISDDRFNKYTSYFKKFVEE